MKAVLVFLSLIFLHLSSAANAVQALTSEQLKLIGEKIYLNETGGKAEHLVAWNDGESFASLGIGHFIWFPENLESPFTETFPGLISYFESRDVAVPQWLLAERDCPWQTKPAFYNAQNSEKMMSLRKLMASTFEQQVEFIYQRMQGALDTMLNELNDPVEKSLVNERFKALAETEAGMYALIDYVNFKGEGTADSEKYQGQGWGLLQVLLAMETDKKNINQAFTKACGDILTRRVENSPQQEVEQRWLAGWKRRCSTYSSFPN
ncbi:hypothetical protein [Brumicola blandensis]|uniref:Uncharacterized protein n=1 Tax=Brumicola blandensis TaxID=3075611 RepID=A0AAW8R3M6_9ALTE|nr:hypothetical protein [Alteromonas sp. W409]MDT0583787.1 hypothetical protein [Alteromonas sp. W409]